MWKKIWKRPKTTPTTINSSATCDLREKSLCDTRVVAIASALLNHRNSTITSLQLSRNNFGNEGAVALARAIQHPHTNIERLYLDSNLIGNEGIHALSSALIPAGEEEGDKSVVSSVRYLGLGDNEFDDVGAKAIASVIRRNSSLIYVGLSGNRIGNDGITAICHALTMNSSIQVMELGVCHYDVRHGWINFANCLKLNHSLVRLQYPQYESARNRKNNINNKEVNEIEHLLELNRKSHGSRMEAECRKLRSFPSTLFRKEIEAGVYPSALRRVSRIGFLGPMFEFVRETISTMLVDSNISTPHQMIGTHVSLPSSNTSKKRKPSHYLFPSSFPSHPEKRRRRQYGKVS